MHGHAGRHAIPSSASFHRLWSCVINAPRLLSSQHPTRKPTNAMRDAQTLADIPTPAALCTTPEEISIALASTACLPTFAGV